MNWTKKTDSAIWNIEVVSAGTYVITLDYTCPAADIGSTVELSFNDTRIRGKVAAAWDPPLITDQDVSPRGEHGESLMKEFRSLTLGEIKLEPGRGELVLRAVDIPGKSVMDLRRVTLTLK